MPSVFRLETNIESKLVTKAGHKKIMRDTNREGGERHKREFLPKHFKDIPETYPGAGGYRYRKRTNKWNKYKRKKVGHTTANVYTGELRKRVTTVTKVTATRNRWRNYVKPGFPMPTWQKSEIEIISNRELRGNVRWFEKTYTAKVNSPTYQKYRRKRFRRK